MLTCKFFPPLGLKSRYGIDYLKTKANYLTEEIFGEHHHSLDISQAIHYFNASAALGYPPAQLELGLLHELGPPPLTPNLPKVH